MTTTGKTEVGVYTGEFFLRCFFLFVCGVLELGVLLMGDFVLGSKTGSIGVYGHNFTISRPTGWDCTEVLRTTRALGHGSFL
jgi:hypothetical protein